METRILIVEDDAQFVRFLERACENELPFLKADFAENGWEAVKKIVTEPNAYSLIAIDVDMTPISGDDLITIVGIFNKYEKTNLQILVISGKVGERPGHFLEKPFDPKEFGAMISKMFDKDS